MTNRTNNAFNQIARSGQATFLAILAQQLSGESEEVTMLRQHVAIARESVILRHANRKQKSNKERSLAQVNCPDRNKGLSPRAPTFASCQHLTTIQKTSQSLKLHSLGSDMMLIVGTAWIIAAVKMPHGDVVTNMIIAGCLTTIGFTWHVVTRIRISRHVQRLPIARKARYCADSFMP